MPLIQAPFGALLCVAGLWFQFRRRSSADWVLLAAGAGLLASLVAMRWPLLRYQFPLVPFLATAAGIALARCPAVWRRVLGTAALLVPLAASVAQLHYMRGPHPANQALEAVRRAVPPGTSVARMIREMPPLDEKLYPMGPNPYLNDLTRDPPAWVLTVDLPDRPYPAANRELLRRAYDQVGDFRQRADPGPGRRWGRAGRLTTGSTRIRCSRCSGESRRRVIR